MPKPKFTNEADQLAEIIRVNQAGEYAANVIYKTQIANTNAAGTKDKLREMLSEEQKHLQFFNEQMKMRRVRPTALMPLWHFLSWGLGKFSATLGEKHMMIATDAVEEVIQQHYNKQIDALQNSNEKELRDKIIQFREDELHHQKLATDNIKNPDIFDSIFSKIIKTGCKAAISISKKI
jgi:ubiquinone biosynthesis monooxygenase Coq7